jgi:hypothetical protein
VISEYTVPRRDWLHGAARCPKCGLPLDPTRDLEEYDFSTGGIRPKAAWVHHKRCGEHFRLHLADAEASGQP